MDSMASLISGRAKEKILMRLVVDTHTHTIASGHAYSTIQEMAKGAADNGIEMMAVTDHGPELPGAPGFLYFHNLKILPDKIHGVRILKGVEANIMDFDGSIDLPERFLGKLDFCMAGYHEPCLKPGKVHDHTEGMIKALSNPYIDAVSHPGNPKYQVDIEAVVLSAKEHGKLIEINNHSFAVRTGSEENCRLFAMRCKEHGVRIVTGSDAHFSDSVGEFGKVLRLLEEVHFPEELVLNTSVRKVDEYIRERMERINRITDRILF
jgi:putative hydrolase